MGTLELVGAAVALGAASGLSLYGTAFLVGFLIRLEWIRLDAGWEPLTVLADPVVMTLAGVLFALEFVADKIPWVDSLWDALHTVIRPIGGALLATRVLGDLDPAAEVVAFLLLGGVTLATHTAKASVRLAVNTSPEPVSNILLSFTEHGLVAGGTWLALMHPISALVVGILALVGAVVATVWLARRAVRGIRALAAWTAARLSTGSRAAG